VKDYGSEQQWKSKSMSGYLTLTAFQSGRLRQRAAVEEEAADGSHGEAEKQPGTFLCSVTWTQKSPGVATHWIGFPFPNHIPLPLPHRKLSPTTPSPHTRPLCNAPWSGGALRAWLFFHSLDSSPSFDSTHALPHPDSSPTATQEALTNHSFTSHSPFVQRSMQQWTGEGVGFSLIESALEFAVRRGPRLLAQMQKEGGREGGRDWGREGKGRWEVVRERDGIQEREEERREGKQDTAESVGSKDAGAILVFMTGWDDIIGMRDRLREHPLLGDESRVLLLTCHGSMPIEEQVRVRWAEKLIITPPPPGVTKVILATNMAETSITINDKLILNPPPPGITTKVIVAISMAETSITINDAVTHSFPYLRPFPPLSNFPKQKLIFNPPPAGVTKVILATNMAETSITINDVALVIDTGKAKETSYDAVNNVPCLLPQWVSKASVKQRRGRAGRVRPGVCFHLYPRPLFAALPDYGQPELLRAPLHSLCLQIKTLGLGNIGEFLGKAIQPPEPLAVDNAIELLEDVGALDKDENLTPLGQLNVLPPSHHAMYLSFPHLSSPLLSSPLLSSPLLSSPLLFLSSPLLTSPHLSSPLLSSPLLSSPLLFAPLVSSPLLSTSLVASYLVSSPLLSFPPLLSSPFLSSPLLSFPPLLSSPFLSSPLLSSPLLSSPFLSSPLLSSPLLPSPPYNSRLSQPNLPFSPPSPGRHLTALPLEPRVGKMLVMAAVLSCVNPVLTVGATLSEREPWVRPADKREVADSVRLRFAGDDCSDHFAAVRAFEGWVTALGSATSRSDGYSAARAYCYDHFLSHPTMQARGGAIAGLRRQLLGTLGELGLVDVQQGMDEANSRSNDPEFVRAALLAGLMSEANSRSNDPEFVRAAQLAGLASAVKRTRSTTYKTEEDGEVNIHQVRINVVNGEEGGTTKGEGGEGEVLGGDNEGGRRGRGGVVSSTTYKTEEDGEVNIHQSSVNAGLTRFPYPWLVFNEKCGVVWRGVAWNGVAWDGVAWDGVAWDGVAWDGVAWDGVAWDGVAWDGVAWDGVAWDGVAWDGVAWDGVAWDGVAWDGVTWDGVAWDGVARLGPLTPTTDPGYLHMLDGYFEFFMPPAAARSVLALRSELDALIQRKLGNPRLPLTAEDEAILGAVSDLPQCEQSQGTFTIGLQPNHQSCFFFLRFSLFTTPTQLENPRLPLTPEDEAILGAVSDLLQCEQSQGTFTIGLQPKLAPPKPAKPVRAKAVDMKLEVGKDFKSYVHNNCKIHFLGKPRYYTDQIGTKKEKVYQCTMRLGGAAAGIDFVGEPASTKKVAEWNAAVEAWQWILEYKKVERKEKEKKEEVKKAGRKERKEIRKANHKMEERWEFWRKKYEEEEAAARAAKRKEKGGGSGGGVGVGEGEAMGEKMVEESGKGVEEKGGKSRGRRKGGNATKREQKEGESEGKGKQELLPLSQATKGARRVAVKRRGKKRAGGAEEGVDAAGVAGEGVVDGDGANEWADMASGGDEEERGGKRKKKSKGKGKNTLEVVLSGDDDVSEMSQNRKGKVKGKSTLEVVLPSDDDGMQGRVGQKRGRKRAAE
ncbi:unnamed protein product, partial [Closterium sp. NIES-65]